MRDDVNIRLDMLRSGQYASLSSGFGAPRQRVTKLRLLVYVDLGSSI
jgi:hypothetical protein